MNRLSVFIGAALVVSLAACGGGSSASSDQAASAAPAAAASTAGTVASTAPADTSASTDVPVYPGATKMPTQIQPSTSCGHKVTMTVYHAAGADLKTVMAWYADKLPGATKIIDKTYSHGASSSEIAEMISGDGRQAALGMQLQMPPAMAKYAAAAAGTTISVGTYDPPVSSEDIAMIKNAMGGDAASKAQAIAAVKAKCGSSYKFGG